MAGLLAVSMLSLAILIHELGHAAGAAACKIRINELIIGFGPKLKQWSMGRLLVTLRAIPVAGALSIDDDDYRRASVARKRIALLSGPTMNMVGGWILCALGKFVATVGRGSLSLRVVDGARFASRVAWIIIPETARAFISAAVGTPAEYVGPIGLAGVIRDLDLLSLVDFPMWLVLAGIVSAGAGLFNLLPLPPLDGGRALILRVEDRLGMRRVGMLERVGIALVAAFGVVVALGDLVKLVF